MGLDPPDNELMMAYQKGDEGAFRILFERYSGRFSGFLKAKLGKKKNHLVEEVFQKTWLKVHGARKSFDGKRNFHSWFYTIALNTLRDEVGSLYEKSKHEELSNADLRNVETSEEAYIKKERFHLVESLLPLLSDNQRTALLLADREELSTKEVAEVMSINEVAVRQLVSRARKLIRTHFKEEV